MIPGDRLLYALSAKQEMGWSAFKKAFELICAHDLQDESLKDVNLARYETARGFDALGHAELDFGANTRLYVGAPALSLLPQSGLPVGLLAGARGPSTAKVFGETIAKSGRNLQLSVHGQRDKSRRFPARVTVTGESAEDLAWLAGEMQVAFQKTPASWTILHFAGSLDEYLSGCEWLRADRLNWEVRQFHIEELRFSVNLSAGELQLLKYIHPSRQYPIYYLWRSTESARVDPDWGRFFVLKIAGQNVLHYDRAASAVILPVTVPLPKLLSRALCLCSGLVPSIIPKAAIANSPLSVPFFRVYPAVPYEFAQIVAQKLDQTLITDLTVSEIEHD